MVPIASAPPAPTRTRRAAVPFAPFEEFSATPAQHEDFAALLWVDRRRNLMRRFTHFSSQNPDQTVKRMGFVPLVLQHGFATLSLSRSRGPSAVCSVGWYYTFGVPDVILFDSRWRVELDLGHAIEQAGKELARRRPRLRGLAPERAVGKALRRALQWTSQPLREIRPAQQADLELHPYEHGRYFYRHYMDRLEVPLLVAETGPATLPLPRFARRR